MPKVRHGQPLWLEHSVTRHRRFSPHRGTLSVDVVIIGGGITGAIAAHLFTEAGVQVALLESREIGRGSTSVSTALLMQEPDRDFVDLAGRYGNAAAASIWRALSRSTRDLVKTIRRLQISCDLRERDSVYFTRTPEKLAALRREFRRRKAARLPGRWLTPEALYRTTGIHGCGGIATSGNAEVNPVRACAGFIDAAVRRGAKVFERSKAIAIDSSGDGVIVKTRGGTIHGQRVVIATGYAQPGFEPLVGRFRMKDTYVIATRALPASIRRRTPSGVMLWDTDRPYHYVRWTKDSRLIIGGADTRHEMVRGSRSRIARARVKLQRFLAEVYPVLANERPEYAWEGMFAETPDGLPFIGLHSRYPRHLFALGYGGNGMTASFLAGQLLVKRYSGRPSAEELLFAFDR